MPTLSKFARLTLASLLSLFAFAMLPMTEAKAGDYSVSVDLDFVYFADQRDGDLEDFSYIGPVLRLHPEYSFTNWFSLGLRVGVGTLFYIKDYYEISDDGKLSETSDSHEVEMLSGYEGLVTAKFKYENDIISAGALLGFGAYIIPDARGKTNVYDDNTWVDVNVTAGFSYKITPGLGLGVHAGFSYIPIFRYAASGGIHIKYSFI